MRFEKLKIQIKFLLNKVLNRVCSIPIKFLLSNEIGRSIIYNSFPNNTLLMCNTLEGIKYIVNSSDKTIGRGTFKSLKSFDSNNLELSLKILNKKKSILLDIGANIGTIGIYAITKKYFEKCLAFEPEPRNFNLLKQNIFINELSDRFETFNIALDDGSKKNISIKLSPDNYGDHRSYFEETNSDKLREEITVPCDKLENVCKELNFKDLIIFMDTQGFEGHILSGAKSLIKQKVPIVTEFWPYGLKKSNGLEKFYESLDNSKYQFLYDLKYPNKQIKFSIEELKKLALDLGDEEHIFTDILIF